MAGVNNERVTTRSSKIRTLGEISPNRLSGERLNRSRKATSSNAGNEEDGSTSRMKLGERSDAAVARTTRKRRKIIDSVSEDEDGETTKSKRTRAVVKEVKNKEQALSKRRELRVLINKQVYDEISVKETYDEESSSEKESGMASSYVTSSSSSSSSSSERDSDSPVPTSELSDSSFDYESSFSSYESSGNEDITWRIRKSPRKKAQAESRKKIVALRSQQFSDSEDNTSTTESESSYHSDD
ncbi:hypothetical protein ABFA07_010124 [Porites harrisoni]